MKFSIRYSDLIDKRKLENIDFQDRKKISRAIEEKLTNNPLRFGKPLRYSLKNCRSLRVGDYRVLYRIQEDEVEILYIDHRTTVYKNFLKHFLYN